MNPIEYRFEEIPEETYQDIVNRADQQIRDTPTEEKGKFISQFNSYLEEETEHNGFYDILEEDPRFESQRRALRTAAAASGISGLSTNGVAGYAHVVGNQTAAEQIMLTGLVLTSASAASYLAEHSLRSVESLLEED